MQRPFLVHLLLGDWMTKRLPKFLLLSSTDSRSSDEINTKIVQA